MITIKEGGDIFLSECEVLVNPVNCVGVMGKGLALQFKEKHPQMFEDYREICKSGLLSPGLLWLWKKRVLCFPTKLNWRDPSKEEYVLLGLEKFKTTYKEKGLTSVAFPLLGAGLGGLNREWVIQKIKETLENLEGTYELYT